MNDSSSRYTFLLLSTALLLLLAASALPWGSITGNRLKDFNLFADLLPERSAVSAAIVPIVDPELEELMLAAADAASSEAPGQGGDGVAAAADTASADTIAWIPPFENAPVVDGHVVVENYTGRPMLERFHAALADASGRVVRVGVLGDSFIEGDIFTQDLRRILQQEYGGQGVGYVPMHSSTAGFRRSVRQSSEGWDSFTILNMPRRDSVRFISGEYSRVHGTASSTYKGSTDGGTTDLWNRSRLVVLAADTAAVTLTADGGVALRRLLMPSSVPQEVILDAPTAKLTVVVESKDATGLGVYLDGATGIAIDCMSSRGSSGLNLRGLNSTNCRAVDYDLIIVEYGINALTAEQSDYTYYRIGMTAALERLKSIYPNADILVLGIADRGAKVDGQVRSLPTCNAMTHAQRMAAQRAGVHFYDIRAAQGGENAIVDWRERQLVNADYIHLNHRGGKAMAEEFAAGLRLSMTNDNTSDSQP